MTLNKVLCFGGRDFRDAGMVATALADLHQRVGGPFLIINGGARGADTLCKEWGLARGWPVITMDAPWTALGKRAGSVRNGWMIEHAAPHYAVGFPGGPGTRDMATQLQAAGIPSWFPFGGGL